MLFWLKMQLYPPKKALRDAFLAQNTILSAQKAPAGRLSDLRNIKKYVSWYLFRLWYMQSEAFRYYKSFEPLNSPCKCSQQMKWIIWKVWRLGTMLKWFFIAKSFRLHISKPKKVPGNIFFDISKVRKSSRRGLLGKIFHKPRIQGRMQMFYNNYPEYF